MSKDIIQVHTPLRDFEWLYEVASAGRAGMAKISKSELLSLLMDHSLLVGKAEDRGYKVVDVAGEEALPIRVRRRVQN